MKKIFAWLLLSFSFSVSALAQSATVTVSDSSYSATGGQITLTVSMTYPAGAVPSLSAKPPGDTWAYISESGTNIPSVKPAAGETTDPTDPTSNFGFTYSSPPAGTASFSFVISYPAGMSGAQVITFAADYRLSGVRTPLTVSSISLAPSGGAVAAPVISSAATASGTAGIAFSYQITASGSPTVFAATGLPAGLSLNTTTGLISGTPSSAGAFTVSLTATNSSGTSAAFVLTLTVNAVAPAITNQPQAQTVTAGAAATFSVVASGTAPLTYQWKKGTVDIVGATNPSYSIPVTVSADAGSYFVTVANSAGTVTSTAASLTVNAAAVAPYSVTAGASTYSGAGGQITLNVSMSYPSGAVPSISAKPPGDAWAYISESGANVPSVKPAAGETTDPTDPTSNFGFTYSSPPAGYASFSFVIGYPAGLTGSQTITFVADYRLGGVRTEVTVPAITLALQTVTVQAPAISSATTSSATVGTAFSYQITASNTPTSYAATGLPAGLSLNTTTGAISGTPTAAGSSTVSLTATNSGGTSAAVSLVLTVAKADQTITFAALPAKTVGDPAFTLSATSSSGGAVTYTSSNSAVATISGNTVTIVGSGSTNIVASQSGTSNYNAAPSVTQVLTVNPAAVAPSITTQPVSQTVAAGAQVTFSVVATGSPAPTFQWRRGGTALAGATNASLTIASVVVSDAGSYDVLVANTVSSVTSSGAVLTVSGAANGVFVYSSDGSSATITGYTGSGGSVTIPSSLGGLSVTAIGENAFVGNTSITSVVIPNTVLSIGPQAFGSCTGLTSVTIPQGVTTIGQGSFDGCTSWVSMALPASVTIIGPNAFRSNLGMASITVDANNPAFSSDGKALYNKSKTTLIKAAVAGISGSYVLPSTVTSIGQHAFRGCVGLTSISLPSGLTSISADAFRGCTSLGDTTFPASVSSIGPLAFDNTPSLLRATFLGNAPTLDSTYPAFKPATLQVAYYLPSGSGWSSTYSGVATVMMAAPAIATQPASVSVTAGTSASFSVSATGTPAPSFQWKKGTLDIAGATNSTYSISTTASGDAGSYFVTVSNAAGSVTSNVATLTVTAPVQVPVISSATTASATVGTAFSFQIAASNSPTSYAATNLPGGLTLNATTGAISGTPTTAGTSSVSLTATNSGGTSAAVTLVITVNAAAVAPSITTQPQSQSVTAGASVTFSVVAAGTTPLSYQWKKGTSNISGATNSSYTIPATTSVDAGSYFVTVSNSAGNATSNAASLTVTTSSGFAFSPQPVAITRSRGETATFQVAATGGTGTVTYKWFKDGTALSDSFGRISGSGTATLTISNVGVGDGGSYSATATTVQNGTITSNGAALTVLSGPTITRPALDAVVRANDSATFSVSATGSGTLTYKWLFTAKNSISAVELTNVSGRFSGATSASLTISTITVADEGFYTCEITDSAGVARSSASLGVFSRVVRVVGQSAAPGSNITVSVQLLGTGTENAAGFSVQFDPNKLTYVAASAALGAQSSDATLIPNESDASLGRLGILISRPVNLVWASGTNEILKLTFTVKSTLTNSDVCIIGFGNSPVPQEVVGADASALPQTGFAAGVVTPLSGYEGDINGNGAVSVTDWVKIGRIVAGLDPKPTGADFLKTDCAPRLNTDGSLRLGNGSLSVADWVQAGRYAAGLDPLTPVGGPSDVAVP